jgi:hypothetical protein
MELPWRLVNALSTSLPCFFMAARLVRVWKDPLGVEDGRWISLGVGVMVLEFVLVHSGVACAVVAGSDDAAGVRLLHLGVIGLGYLLFAGVIALAFRSAMLLQSFLTLIVGRAVSVYVGLTQDQAAFLVAQSVLAVILYFFITIASVIVPVPRFGLTADVVRGRVRGRGVWVEEPHRAIAAATVYFSLLGAADLLVLPWLPLGSA